MKPTRKNRSRAYYRHHRRRVISRKKKFAKQAWDIEYYYHDGQYSKGKIHCSCSMCKCPVDYKFHSAAKSAKYDDLTQRLLEYFTY